MFSEYLGAQARVTGSPAVKGVSGLLLVPPQPASRIKRAANTIRSVATLMMFSIFGPLFSRLRWRVYHRECCCALRQIVAACRPARLYFLIGLAPLKSLGMMKVLAAASPPAPLSRVPFR